MTIKFEARIAQLNEAHSRALIAEGEKKTLELNGKLSELEASLAQKHANELENVRTEHAEFVSLIKNDYSQQNQALSQDTTKLTEQITELNTQLVDAQNELAIFKANDKTVRECFLCYCFNVFVLNFGIFKKM